MLESFSHEIKTPLNGAIGPLETCIYKQHLSKPFMKKYLVNSYRSLQLLVNTLNNIIDLTYLRAKKLTL